MRTSESNRTQHDAREQCTRVLEDDVERSKPLNNWFRGNVHHQSTAQRHISRFLNGVESFSLFPQRPVRGSILKRLPSDTDSIRNDWTAVGHDLCAAILYSS